MKLKLFIQVILLTVIFTSCSEEVFVKKTIDYPGFTAPSVQNFNVTSCAQMHFNKPPVDILYVVDNTGSTNNDQFQALKTNIAQTLGNISSDFNYHVYVAPLLPQPSDDIHSYPLIISGSLSDFPGPYSSLNITTAESLSIFSTPTGQTGEPGFQRVIDLINNNRSNGIFREGSNVVVVLVSNGDDTSVYYSQNGVTYFQSSKYNDLKNQLLNFTQRHNPSSGLRAESFRFLSLVAHSQCGSSVKIGRRYKDMSKDIYDAMGYTDDSSHFNSYDLCSGNYNSLFGAVNNSIKKILIGHSYDYWKISSASASSIQADDITVTKIRPDGTKVNIPESTTNGFEYIEHQTNQNTRYLPTAGEPATGLMIRLYGSARVDYPDCIIAKTRTPTEYFGYIAIESPRPDPDTITVQVRGENVPRSETNGWSYIGYHEILNIKVPGPEGVSTQPPLNKAGYFIKLNGSYIFTNGETVNVYFKPASL